MTSASAVTNRITWASNNRPTQHGPESGGVYSTYLVLLPPTIMIVIDSILWQEINKNKKGTQIIAPDLLCIANDNDFQQCMIRGLRSVRSART